jgi:hypothetical protein
MLDFGIFDHLFLNFEKRFFRDVFTNTSIEGFVAVTIVLYTIPGNMVNKL